ncbi:hypothetical protein [Streptomyces sp. XY332]|uniref:hypothetical protein n=1 Tax=Streptomyces sp. XY332 TaxID=1415561 RepID=UPI0006B168D2|nr:hypothetical protein [Streptomyces sp. XY332]
MDALWHQFEDHSRDAEGVDTKEARTPGEPRHGFVSLPSGKGGVPLEEISRLVGHSGSAVTEAVYRNQIAVP